MERNIALFYQGALDCYLSARYFPESACLKIELGKKQYCIYLSNTPLNQGASVFIAQNKSISNQLLKSAGFSVPQAISISRAEWLSQPLSSLIQGLTFPVVLKPMIDTCRGLDVLCNIKTIDELSLHLTRLFSKYKFVQIEVFYQNLKEYRVLILNRRVIGVVQRFGASVRGDGEHTIEALIAESNKERARLNLTLSKAPLVVDEEYKACLKEQKLTLQSILPPGKKVQLCHTANTGRGGDIVSLGKTIHPENAALLIRANETLGLKYAGLDVLCEDIERPFSQKKWVILEVNPHPDITIHEVPDKGIQAKVAKKVMIQLILRHPFAYAYHLAVRSPLAIYIKAGLIATIFGLMLIYHSV